MKKLLAALFFLPAAAAGHVSAVYPVKVRLKADPGCLRVTVEAHVVNWRFLTGVSAPAEDGPWPEDLRRRAMAYIEGHLPFSVDGKPLAGKVLGGRVSRPLGKNVEGDILSVHAVYELPAGGRTLAARAGFFREEWAWLEGAGYKAPAGLPREFHTLFRWGILPGASLRTSFQEGDMSIPLKKILRSAPGRWWESVWTGIRTVFGVGGAMVLLGAAMLFPPGVRAVKAGLVAAAAAGAAGVFLARGAPASALETASWMAVVAVALSSSLRRPAVLWAGGVAAGAFCSVPVWISAGADFRDLTGFAGFSWPAFLLGGALLLSAAEGVRRLWSRGYRRYFGFLTPDELERQSLFHRKIAVRMAAIAGVYRILSPLWTKAP